MVVLSGAFAICGCRPILPSDPLSVVVIVADVVAVVDVPTLTARPGVPEVVVAGAFEEPVGFSVERVFADAAELALASFDCLVSSNSRRRSASHDWHSIKSPLPMVTDLSFRFCGQGPLGSPSQTGIAQINTSAEYRRNG